MKQQINIPKLKDYFLPIRKQTSPTACGIYATCFAAEAKANMRQIGTEQIDIDTLMYNWNLQDNMLDKEVDPFLQQDVDKDKDVDDLERIFKLRLWCRTYSLEGYNIQEVDHSITSLKETLKNMAIPILYIKFQMRGNQDMVQTYSSNTQPGLPWKKHVVAVRDVTDEYIELQDSNGGEYNRIYLKDTSIIESAWVFNTRPWEKEFNYPLKKVCITQGFGERYDYYWNNFKLPGHTGIDMKAYTGTEVYPCFNGIVTKIDFNKYEGNRIFMTKGDYCVKLAHLSKINCKVGDRVSINKPIALSGNTGSSTTAPHLHLDIQFKKFYIDPTILIEQH